MLYGDFLTRERHDLELRDRAAVEALIAAVRPGGVRERYFSQTNR